MPAATLKVSLEIPELDQGEIDENPMPAPKANRTSVKAAVATAPAAMAAQDTADWFSSRAPARVSVLKLLVMVRAMVSMFKSGVRTTQGRRKKFRQRVLCLGEFDVLQRVEMTPTRRLAPLAAARRGGPAGARWAPFVLTR